MSRKQKKYIAGNILLQWLELALNTVMVITVAKTVSKLYYKEWTMNDLTVPIIIIIGTLIIRFFTAQGATRMSYLASKTVKQKMRELIYGKLLKLGSKYREQVSTAELVQESAEGVDQLESYFGLYVPQFLRIYRTDHIVFPVWLRRKLGNGGCASDMRTADSRRNRHGAEDRKKTACEILGTVRTAWKYLS